MANVANKGETNWTYIVGVVLAVLIVYIWFDAYVFTDPLTQVAQRLDNAIDLTSGSVGGVARCVAGPTIDAADAVFRRTVNATGAVIGTTVGAAGYVVGGAANAAGYVVDATGNVIAGTGRLIRGTANLIGDTLIYTGEVIRVDRNGNVKLIDQSGNVIPIAAEEANVLLNKDAVVKQQHANMVANGVIPSETEGVMNQNVSGVVAAEHGQESEVMTLAQGRQA